jgi:hypothetical protein
MTRTRLVWLGVVVALAVVVAYQVVGSSGHRADFVAQADIPTVAAGVDVLGASPKCRSGPRPRLPQGCVRRHLTDDNLPPAIMVRHNDILDRDLVDKTYVSIKGVPTQLPLAPSGPVHQRHRAVRRNQVAQQQIDHISRWHTRDGARQLTDDVRLRFALRTCSRSMAPRIRTK